MAQLCVTYCHHAPTTGCLTTRENKSAVNCNTLERLSPVHHADLYVSRPCENGSSPKAGYSLPRRLRLHAPLAPSHAACGLACRLRLRVVAGGSARGRTSSRDAHSKENTGCRKATRCFPEGKSVMASVARRSSACLTCIEEKKDSLKAGSSRQPDAHSHRTFSLSLAEVPYRRYSLTQSPMDCKRKNGHFVERPGEGEPAARNRCNFISHRHLQSRGLLPSPPRRPAGPHFSIPPTPFPLCSTNRPPPRDEAGNPAVPIT